MARTAQPAAVVYCGSDPLLRPCPRTAHTHTDTQACPPARPPASTHSQTPPLRADGAKESQTRAAECRLSFEVRVSMRSARMVRLERIFNAARSMHVPCQQLCDPGALHASGSCVLLVQPLGCTHSVFQIQVHVAQARNPKAKGHVPHQSYPAWSTQNA